MEWWKVGCAWAWWELREGSEVNGVVWVFYGRKRRRGRFVAAFLRPGAGNTMGFVAARRTGVEEWFVLGRPGEAGRAVDWARLDSAWPVHFFYNAGTRRWSRASWQWQRRSGSSAHDNVDASDTAVPERYYASCVALGVARLPHLCCSTACRFAP